MELPEADLICGQVVGRAPEVGGELCDGGDVGFDGFGRIVPELELLDHALTQRGHGCLLGQEALVRDVRCASESIGPLANPARSSHQEHGRAQLPRSGYVQLVLRLVCVAGSVARNLASPR
jgi:hypothetical protein